MASRYFGFVGDDVDVSSVSDVYPASSSSLFLFPLSAFPGDAYSGFGPYVSFGSSRAIGGFRFSEYRSDSYVWLGRDPGFDSAFIGAGTRYRCTVDDGSSMHDLWLLFDGEDPASVVGVGIRPPKAWEVPFLPSANCVSSYCGDS